MQAIAWVFLDLLINLFESGMFVGFVFQTLDCKIPARRRTLLFTVPTLVLWGLLTVFKSLDAPEGTVELCRFAVTFVTAAVFFQGSLVKKFAFSLLPIMMIALSNAIGVNLTAVIFRLSPAELPSSRGIRYIVLLLIVYVLFFLLWYILKCFLNRRKMLLTKADWLLLSIVITVSVIIFILTVAVFIFVQLYLIGFYTAEDSIQLYIAMTMVFLIAMDFTVCFLFVQLTKKHAVMMENSLLRQQYEFGEKSATDIKRQYDNLQKMRHDYKNVLLMLQNLNAGGKQQEIEEFISSYLSELDVTPTIITTDNEYVNAIVNLKVAQSREAGISVTVDIPAQIGFPHPIDLCTILGNLFDNAIEACARCTEENRSIHLSLTQKNEQFAVFIKNTVAESVLKTNPYLLTHKNDTARHGYGIKIIKETAQKHHGFADFYEEDRFFCCNVVLHM